MVEFVLNSEYFNSLRFNKIRKKYYDATAVDTAIIDIRIRADEMSREISGLQKSLDSKEAEIAVLKARLCQMEAKAAEAAKEEADREERAAEQQNVTLNAVNDFYSKVRAEYERQIENLNGMWQDFLCGLENENEDVPADLENKVGKIALEIREMEEQ